MAQVREDTKEEKKAPPAVDDDGKDEKKEADSLPSTATIGDWLQTSGHPALYEAYFTSRNVQRIVDVAALTDRQFTDLVANLPEDSSDAGARRRVQFDLDNYRRLLNVAQPEQRRVPVRGAGGGGGDGDDPAGAAGDVDALIDQHQLGYLGMYKAVVVDYLWHKRLQEQPACNTLDPGDDMCNAAVAVTLGRRGSDAVIVTGTGVASNMYAAEFGAYKAIFANLLTNPMVDQKVLRGIVRKYRPYTYIYQRSRRAKDSLWLYFWGFRKMRGASVRDRAQYFLEKNSADAFGGKRSWIPMKLDKQGVWFDGFYFMFREEIESNQMLYDLLVLKHTDLVWCYMRSYVTRLEFFGCILHNGLDKAMVYLSARQ